MQQHSIDFVAALTTEPSVDFVAALSAEQGCDVCHELHASVYELRCSRCEAAICPDCACMRPDTSLACSACFARHPVRVFESGRGSRGPRRSSQLVLAQARENVASVLEGVRQLMRRVRAGEGLAANLRLLLLSALAALRQRLPRRERISDMRVLTTGLPARDAITRTVRLAHAQSARVLAVAARHARLGWARTDVSARLGWARASGLARVGRARVKGLVRTGRARANGLARVGWARVSRTARAGAARATVLARAGAARATVLARVGGARVNVFARHGWSRSRALALQVAAYTRETSVRLWLALRGIPVRDHAVATMLTVLVLYAVARADHRDA